MTPKPLALDAYEKLAEACAARVDTKPHNAWCERPATFGCCASHRFSVSGLNETERAFR